MKHLLAWLTALFLLLNCPGADAHYAEGARCIGANYFGTGADGATTISADTNLTSTLDGDFVVKNYTTLTINSTKTLSVSNRCKGLIIYCTGACDIQGTLSMDLKGAAFTAPAEGVNLQYAVDSSGARGLIADYRCAGVGGAGGAQTLGASDSSNAGSAGATNQTGGGGSGTSSSAGYGKGGAGAAGSAFCGGSGGGAGGFSGGQTDGGAGATNGGAGGVGGPTSTPNDAAGGGAGNPAGAGSFGGTGTVSDSPGGGGGVIYLVVGGNLTVGASGIITANGSRGGNAGGGAGVGGGGAGGGRVVVLYVATLSNSGTIRANGGVGGTGDIRAGAVGGAGVVTGPTKVAGR